MQLEGRPLPTFMLGLPVHPLVVHAVVVLVPAAVIGAVLVALWPRIRARRGWPRMIALPRVDDGQPRVGIVVLAVLRMSFAVLSAVQVVRVGDRGARAAWRSMQYAPQPRPSGRPAD
ncbi:hypothetical protein [Pseudonocardia sp. D17]|uniref:hypothetical protein n=1 Tax=Pseudonocardia sp. D17 TaxID=882661 RepID=UPI002B378193|nr:hypothetical protein PSD17_19870 [Pseudonocardia sp. D17]